jgi:single-strand DNA-binding protein
MIKLQIIGNLGKDCIVNEVNGKTVINFSVAHTEKYKSADGNLNERTTWVECAYWTDRTAVAQYLTKGKMVYAEGSPSADAYTNKEGKAAGTLRMRVQTIQLLGGNSEAGSGSGYSAQQNHQSSGNFPRESAMSNTMAEKNEVPDDLPF